MNRGCRRPDILLIVAHDLGTRLGSYGQSSVETPALDRLAAQGALFTNHFATAPFCSPSRGSLITGMYPHVNGLMGLVNLGWDLPRGNVTLATALGSCGYETNLFGLQHEVGLRSRLGFHNCDVIEGGDSCDNVAPRVIEYLEGRAVRDPFYARVGFGEVHRAGGGYEKYEPDDPSTIRVPPYMKDTPGARKDLACFHGAIRKMDAAVGGILAALESTGRSKNTLVIFTTDHGIAFPGAKATCYDPGLRTSLIVRWPDRLSGTYDDLLSNVDLFPTILEAAGAAVPPGLQGRSFLPLLSGKAYPRRRLIFAEKNTQPGDIKRCVRTERFKYIRNYDEGPRLLLPLDIEASSSRRDMGDEHLAPRPPVELYDLQADPWERKNLAGSREMLEQELSAELNGIMEATQDPLLAGSIERPPEEAEIFRRIQEKWGTS